MQFSYTDMLFFFFFKQKTAYEIDMDWSSDVCSSDLMRDRHAGCRGTAKGPTHGRQRRVERQRAPHGTCVPGDRQPARNEAELGTQRVRRGRRGQDRKSVV